MAAHWIVLYAAIIHVVWGGCILWDARATWTTPLYGLAQFTPYWVTGLALIGMGCAAIGGLVDHVRGQRSIWAFVCILVQQVAMVIQFSGQLMAVLQSSYADGVVRPQMFIFADQLPGLLIVVFHTVAILTLYWKVHPLGRI